MCRANFEDEIDTTQEIAGDDEEEQNEERN